MSGRTNEEDPLRAAMERVRGNAQPPKRDIPQAASSDNVVALKPKRPSPLDVRGRMANVLARVDEPAAAVWPAPAAGLISGVWSGAMSMLATAFLVIIGWVFAPLGSGQFGDVMRASVGAWLVADGGSIRWQGATLSLPPLLLTFVIMLFQRRAGRWLTRAVAAESPRALLGPLLFAVIAATSLHVILGAAIASETLFIGYARSAAGAAAVALMGFLWGMHAELRLEWPTWFMQGIAITRVYLAGLFAASAALLLVLMVSQRSAFFAVLHAVAGDATSTVQVLLLCLVYLPTLLLWIAAAVVGGSVTLGVGTSMSLHAVSLGALPPFPLLALLPNAIPVWATWCIAIAPVAAVTTLVILRPVRDLRVRGVALAAVLVPTAWCGAAASGGIGPGRLVSVGPAPLLLAIACVGWLGLGMTLELAYAYVVGVLAARRAPATSDDVA